MKSDKVHFALRASGEVLEIAGDARNNPSRKEQYTMKNLELTFSDICSLKALEDYAFSLADASETLDILRALVLDTDEAYNSLSHPAKMLYLAISAKEDA